MPGPGLGRHSESERFNGSLAALSRRDDGPSPSNAGFKFAAVTVPSFKLSDSDDSMIAVCQPAWQCRLGLVAGIARPGLGPGAGPAADSGAGGPGPGRFNLNDLKALQT